MDKTIVYTFKKATKGTFVFENSQETPALSIYLPKTYFAGTAPTQITVKITA
jgi:hypothetical protein